MTCAERHDFELAAVLPGAELALEVSDSGTAELLAVVRVAAADLVAALVADQVVVRCPGEDRRRDVTNVPEREDNDQALAVDVGVEDALQLEEVGPALRHLRVDPRARDGEPGAPHQLSGCAPHGVDHSASTRTTPWFPAGR
jgi:hypothetical protein